MCCDFEMERECDCYGWDDEIEMVFDDSRNSRKSLHLSISIKFPSFKLMSKRIGVWGYELVLDNDNKACNSLCLACKNGVSFHIVSKPIEVGDEDLVVVQK